MQIQHPISTLDIFPSIVTSVYQCKHEMNKQNKYAQIFDDGFNGIVHLARFQEEKKEHTSER